MSRQSVATVSRARKKDESQVLYTEMGECSKRCRSCKYADRFNSALYYCHYILDTGHRRPCPAGKGCTCYEEADTSKKKPKKVMYYAQKCKKRCPMCNEEFIGANRQIYCVECANKRASDCVKRRKHAIVIQRQDEEYQKIKYCRLCGREYHSRNIRVAYCDKCLGLPATSRKRMVKERAE